MYNSSKNRRYFNILERTKKIFNYVIKIIYSFIILPENVLAVNAVM